MCTFGFKFHIPVEPTKMAWARFSLASICKSEQSNSFFQNLSEKRLFYGNGSKLCILGTSERVLLQPKGLLYNFFLNSKCCSHPHPPTHSLTHTHTHTAAENESSLWMLDCLICNVIPCLTVTGWQTGIGSIIQNYLLCISFTTKPNTLTLPNMLIRLVCSRCFGG